MVPNDDALWSKRIAEREKKAGIDVLELLRSEPIVILRNFLDDATLREKLSLEALRTHYGDMRVDLVVQVNQSNLENIPGDGWHLPEQRAIRAPLGPYIDKMLDQLDHMQKEKDVRLVMSEEESGNESDADLNNTYNDVDVQKVTKKIVKTSATKKRRKYNTVCSTSRSRPWNRNVKICGETTTYFAANIDLTEHCDEFKYLKSAIPRNLWWHDAPSNILQLLRAPVPGVTLPQLYLKVKGAWTGGHEENGRFASVNCCHGPEPSKWFAVRAEHVQKLRTYVMKHYKIDLYACEGNWWPIDIDALQKKCEIPIQTGIQYPGDIVILQGSTVHWVVAQGPSVHSSWNLGTLDASQIQHALERSRINDQELRGRIPNVVPISTLVQDLAAAILDNSSLTSIAEKSQHENNNNNNDTHAKVLKVRCRLAEQTGPTVLALRRQEQETYFKSNQCLLASSELLAARRNRALMDVLFYGLDEMLTKATQDQRILLEKLNTKPVREPPGVQVIRCDACALELTQIYTRCETCLRLCFSSKADSCKQRTKRQREPRPTLSNSEALTLDDPAVFFCADCTIQHTQDYDEHRVIALTKKPFSHIRRLVARFDKIRQNAKIADNMLPAPSMNSILLPEITDEPDYSDLDLPPLPTPSSPPEFTHPTETTPPYVDAQESKLPFDDISLGSFDVQQPICPHPVEHYHSSQHVARALPPVYPIPIFPSPSVIQGPAWYHQPTTTTPLAQVGLSSSSAQPRPTRMLSFQQLYYQRNNTSAPPPTPQQPRPPPIHLFPPIAHFPLLNIPTLPRPQPSMYPSSYGSPIWFQQYHATTLLESRHPFF